MILNRFNIASLKNPLLLKESIALMNDASVNPSLSSAKTIPMGHLFKQVKSLLITFVETQRVWRETAQSKNGFHEGNNHTVKQNPKRGHIFLLPLVETELYNTL